MTPQLSPSPDLARDAARPHIAKALDGLPTTLAGAPAFDPEFRTAERIDLDEHSWIDVVPGWLESDETLMIDLLRTAGWEQRERRIFRDRPGPQSRRAAAVSHQAQGQWRQHAL